MLLELGRGVALCAAAATSWGACSLIAAMRASSRPPTRDPAASSRDSSSAKCRRLVATSAETCAEAGEPGAPGATAPVGGR